MSQKINRIARKLKSFWPIMKGIGKVSFSQFGEDIIMMQMLQRFGVTNITYLDIGANDPINGSNTYNFYLRGNRGVLIEPNAVLYNKIRKIRPNDTCLNFGISSTEQSEADYYMFSEAHCGMNTFSKQDALDYEKEGFPIKSVIKMPLKGINKVIEENFTEAPTIVSLDVEGLDEIILQTFDFNKYQPLLVCVETVNFNVNRELTKRKSVLDLMASKGYFIYADTHVNTIFCSRLQFDKLIR
ncbi:MAG: FkbM family methyltransferase [Taibaiella sp.]|nr:FkbM family methyltransferase [Taibaiella sp.]